MIVEIYARRDKKIDVESENYQSQSHELEGKYTKTLIKDKMKL